MSKQKAQLSILRRNLAVFPQCQKKPFVAKKKPFVAKKCHLLLKKSYLFERKKEKKNEKPC